MVIHTEVYILIDMCSVEARVINSTGGTKFYPVAILFIAVNMMSALQETGLHQL